MGKLNRLFRRRPGGVLLFMKVNSCFGKLGQKNGKGSPQGKPAGERRRTTEGGRILI